MKNRKFILLTVCVIMTASFALSGCSNKSSKGDSKLTESTSKKASGSNTNSSFTQKVSKVCSSINTSVFDNLSNPLQGSSADPEAFKKSMQAAEDEFDRVISEFRDIKAPAGQADDWETLISDFEAMRDALPKLTDLIIEFTGLQSSLQNSSDTGDLARAQAKLKSLQDKLVPITEDLSQRSKEIQTLSEKLEIKDCSLIEKTTTQETTT